MTKLVHKPLIKPMFMSSEFVEYTGSVM